MPLVARRVRPKKGSSVRSAQGPCREVLRGADLALSVSIGRLDSLLPQVPAQVARIAREEHEGIASRRLNSERQSGGEARSAECPALATRRAYIPHAPLSYIHST